MVLYIVKPCISQYNISEVIPVSLPESKRKANNKWDAANMTVLGCKIRKNKADQFKAACKRNGTTPNAIFVAAIERFMAEHEAGHEGGME